MQNVKYINGENFRYFEDTLDSAMDIALIHMGREECKPYHAISATRTEYILHYVLSGSGLYSAGGETKAVGSGEIFLIYPGEPVFYCSDRLTPWSYAWVGFRGLRAEGILSKCGFSHDHLILKAPDSEEFLSVIDEFFNYITPDFSDSLSREALLLKLFASLAREHSSRILDGTQREELYHNPYVHKAVRYIGEHYMKNISVVDIADHIGISRAHLNHAFQSELSCSVQSFLIDFRLHRAADLLSEGSAPVKEISSLVGYRDQLVFSKAFKKKYGLSPANYRLYNGELETRTRQQA